MALTRVSTGGIQDDAVTDAKLPANSVGNSEMKDDAVGIAELSATGTASSSTFLRGDNTWVTPTDTNTQLTTEEVQDIVGAMFTGNTETNITATYQDADGTIDLVSTDTDTQVGGATGVDFNDNVKIRLGTGNDIEIYHNGFHSIMSNVTGEFHVRGDNVILASQTTYEKYLQGTYNGAVELYYNNSKKLETSTNGTTLTGNLFISDSADTDSGRIKLGAGEDLQIYHEGANSYLNDTGTGSLILKSSEIKLHSATGEDLAKFTPDGAAELYYDNAKKLETVTGGVTVTGVCTATSFAGDGSSLTGVSTSGGSSGIDFNDNVKARFGTGNDLEIYHDGSHSFIKDAGTGNLRLGAADLRIQTEDFAENYILGTKNGSVDLYYDNAKKFETTANGCKLADGVLMEFGDSGEFTIDHGANTNTHIKHTGAGHIYMQSVNDIYLRNNTSQENYAKFINNGAVELYHNNVKTFQTASDGIQVLGTEGANSAVHIYADEGDDDPDKWRIVAEYDNSHLWIQNYASGSWESNIKCVGNGNTELYYDSSKKLETGSAGVTVTGNIYTDGNVNLTADNKKIRIGAGEDLQLYHDGSNSYILDDGTGDLILNSNTIRFKNAANDEHLAIFDQNNYCSLYYDNSKKLETTSGGVTLHNDVLFDNGTNAGKDIFFDASANKLEFSDDVIASFGNSSDLQIYHDGSHSYIKDTGTGELKISSNKTWILNAAGDETIAIFNQNSPVELYYDNVKKFETSSAGGTLTGHLTVTGEIISSDDININADNKKLNVGASADIQIYSDGDDGLITAVTDDLRLQAADDITLKPQGGEDGIEIVGNGEVSLFYDNSKKLGTFSNGVEITGNFLFHGDGVETRWGGGSDLRIYHNGDWNYIQSYNSKNFVIQVKDTENAIAAIPDGEVQLYYDNSKKLYTSSNGAVVESGSANFEVYSSDVNSDAKITIIGTTGSGGVGQAGRVEIVAQSTDNSSGGSAMLLRTRKTNNTVTTALRIDSDQRVLIGTSSSGSGLGSLQVVEDESVVAINGRCTNGSFNSAVIHAQADRNTTNGSYSFFNAVIHSIQTKFIVYDSGNVVNINNSYGQLSDSRLKENIEDANSQWNDIKSLKFRKYNFTEASGSPTHTQIGLVAQEAETVCPHLVEEQPMEIKGVKEDYKTLKSSVLYMKGMKALQEAMEKIEILEAKVAALESS